MKNYQAMFLKSFPVFGLRSAQFLAFLWLMASCGGGGGVSSKHVKIPQDVTMAVSVDMKSISSKAENWKEIFEQDLLDNLDEDTDKLQEAFGKALASDVNFDQKAYFFFSYTPEGKENYFGASFLLNDPAKFEQDLTEGEVKYEIKTDGDLKYVLLEDEGLMGWKGETALIYSMEGGVEEAKLKEGFDRIFATEASNSLSANSSEFKNIDGGGHDVAVWWDQKKLNQISSDFEDMKESSPALAKIYQAYRVGTIGLDFNKGEVLVKSVSHLDKNHSQELKGLIKSGMNEGMIGSFPTKVPSAMLGLALNMQAIYDLVKEEPSIKDAENDVQRDLGMSMQELFDTFNGDYFVATQDLKMEQIIRNPQPEFVLAIGINNKENIDKIMQKGVDAGAFRKTGDLYTVSAGLPSELYMIEKNDVLYATMSEAYKDDLMQGNGKLDSKYVKIASDKSAVFYLSIQEIVRQIPNEFMSSTEAKVFKNEVAPQLDAMITSSGSISGEKLEGEMKVTFTDKSKNSLALIGEMIKKMEGADEPVSQLQ